jgi:CRISPR-associated protein Cmr5
MLKSLDISRAKYAYEKVSEINKKNIKKNYLSLVRSFPIMIHNNGYASAIALLYSKKKINGINEDNEYMQLYKHISEWLIENQKIISKVDLMESITSKTNEEYKRLSNETMALLIWLKRFAEGMISDECEKTSTNKTSISS